MSNYVIGLSVGKVFVLAKNGKVVPIEEHKRPIVASKEAKYSKTPKIDWVNRSWK